MLIWKKSSQLPKVLWNNDVVWLLANGPSIFVNQKIYSRSCYINISRVDFFHLFCIITFKMDSSSILKPMQLPAGECLFIFMEASAYCEDMSCWSKLFWISTYHHKWALRGVGGSPSWIENQNGTWVTEAVLQRKFLFLHTFITHSRRKLKDSFLGRYLPVYLKIIKYRHFKIS